MVHNKAPRSNKPLLMVPTIETAALLRMNCSILALFLAAACTPEVSQDSLEKGIVAFGDWKGQAYADRSRPINYLDTDSDGWTLTFSEVCGWRNGVGTVIVKAPSGTPAFSGFWRDDYSTTLDKEGHIVGTGYRRIDFEFADGSISLLGDPFYKVEEVLVGNDGFIEDRYARGRYYHWSARFDLDAPPERRERFRALFNQLLSSNYVIVHSEGPRLDPTGLSPRPGELSVEPGASSHRFSLIGFPQTLDALDQVCDKKLGN